MYTSSFFNTSSNPRSRSPWRPKIHRRIKRNSGGLRLVDIPLELAVLDGNGRLVEVVDKQLIPHVGREAVIRDQGAPEPHALVVLDPVVALIGKTETVRARAVLVVHHLGMLAVPANAGRVADLVVPVLGRGDVHGTAIERPHGDVLPVVGVSDVEEIGDCDVLLEVVVIQVDAPPVRVAALAGIDIVVVEVRQVAAAGRETDKVVGEALHNVPVAVDGRHVVASVRVEVQRRLEPEVVGRGALGKCRGRVGVLSGKERRDVDVVGVDNGERQSCGGQHGQQ
jgi:hypothetical protein